MGVNCFVSVIKDILHILCAFGVVKLSLYDDECLFYIGVHKLNHNLIRSHKTSTRGLMPTDSSVHTASSTKTGSPALVITLVLYH